MDEDIGTIHFSFFFLAPPSVKITGPGMNARLLTFFLSQTMCSLGSSRDAISWGKRLVLLDTGAYHTPSSLALLLPGLMEAYL